MNFAHQWAGPGGDKKVAIILLLLDSYEPPSPHIISRRFLGVGFGIYYLELNFFFWNTSNL